VLDRVRFLCGDLTAPLEETYRADVLLSNPPYIPTGELNGLMREVADYEPRIALDGGPDGLTFYRRLLQEGTLWIKPGGLLALEIGCAQGRAVSALLKDSGLFCQVSLLQDLSGMDRVVSGITHHEGRR
jgi:release factor glutamine methyltransferase